MWRVFIVFAVVWVVTSGCNRAPGAPKVPVTGQVLVNGEPAAYMIVRFHAPGQGLAGQDAQPAALADDQGRFSLSSFGGNDGAAAATYKVTFYWPTNPIAPSQDRLQGAYVHPKASGIEVTIGEEATQLPPFELNVDPKRLLPAQEILLPGT